MQRLQHYIDGREAAPSQGGYFESFNPYTGKPWVEVARGTPDDVEQAVIAADRAFSTGPWAAMTGSERGRLMHRLGDLIAREAEDLAKTEVRDNGKLYAEMLSQMRYMPNWYYYFGGLADKIEGAVIPVDRRGFFTFTRHEPLGVVVAITPWNSPLLLLSYKLAPALAAGCTVVVKPSEYTSASALRLARLFDEAGFPPGVVNVVTGFGAEIGAALVEHPLVRKITFTGSDQTGRAINQLAAKSFKHVSLELGGKSPNIVFADAVVEDAVRGAVSGIYAASGQTCVAGSRLLLQESLHDEFMEKLLAISRGARMGDPMAPETQVGPVATRPQYEKVLDYIRIAKAEGADLLTGGRPGSGPDCGQGWFVEPTIFDRVTNDMRIAREEVFGPVLSVLTFRDEDEALAIANDSRFGLAAGVWTGDIGRAMRMSERLQAGTVWVNSYRVLSYMAPFGGYKDSGLGRENGIEAVKEYLQVKSTWINTGAPTADPFVRRG